MMEVWCVDVTCVDMKIYQGFKMCITLCVVVCCYRAFVIRREVITDLNL